MFFSDGSENLGGFVMFVRVCLCTSMWREQSFARFLVDGVGLFAPGRVIM